MVFGQRCNFFLSTVVQPKKGYLALLLAATLSACQTVPVERSDIADVIPMQWPQSLLQNTTGAQQPHQMSWWEFVEDPLLRQIIGEAIDYNRDLQMAVLRVEEAAAILQLRWADQFPTIGVDGQASRSRVPADMSMTQRSAISSDYGLTVGMSSWELDLWGRIRSLKDAALEEFLAGTYARHAVQASLVAEVARTYLSLQTLDEQIAIAERSIATRQESYRIFKRRHEVGASSFLELTQVETLLMQARVLASQLKQERVDVANALTVLVGKPVDFNAPDAIVRTANTTSTFKSINVGLPSVVLLQRPDIVAAEHRIRAAEANITAARAAYFPRIALTTGAGTASAQLSGLFDGGSGSWIFSPQLSLPIFDAGTRAANVEAARVRAEMAVVEYEDVIQKSFREVADALNHRHFLAEQVTLEQRVVKVQQERTRLAELRYSSGAVSYLEVLDAHRELLSAQQALAQDQGNLRLSVVDLYSALGGGTQLPPSEASTEQIVTVGNN